MGKDQFTFCFYHNMLPITRYGSLLCLITSVFPNAVAQGYDDGRSPIREFSRGELNKAMTDPDAFGEVFIPDPSGFDLTEEWPGSEADGWKARIEIKANVPVSNDGYTTLTRISYVPPDPVDIVTNDSMTLTAQDTSWLTCSHLWVSPKLAASPEEVDGLCSAVLSTECTDDILLSLREGFFGYYDSGWPGPNCPPTLLPDPCRSKLGNDTRLLATEPGMRDSKDFMMLDRWIYYEEFDVHAEDDDTLYQEAVERVWMLGTAWGYSKYSQFANGTDPNINATVTCLRAKELSASEKESGGGGDDQEDKSSMQSAWSRWDLLALII